MFTIPFFSFFDILFFSIPIFVIAFFVVTLYNYLSARKQNRKNPDAVSPEELKKRKILLIISSAVAIVFVAVVIGFAALLFMSIAYM